MRWWGIVVWLSLACWAQPPAGWDRSNPRDASFDKDISLELMEVQVGGKKVAGSSIPVTPGDRVTLVLRVSNLGKESTGPYQIGIQDARQTWSSKVYPSIMVERQQVQRLDLDIPPAASGPVHLTVRVSLQSGSSRDNPANNSATLTLDAHAPGQAAASEPPHPGSAPDLMIEGVGVSDPQFTEKTVLEIRIVNKGGSDAPAADVLVNVGGRTHMLRTSGPVVVGKTSFLSYEVDRPFYQKHRVTVTVDPNNKIAESNKSNNSRQVKDGE